MSAPSLPPSNDPSSDPPPARRGNPNLLVPGIKPGQRRGPDGRLLPKKLEEPPPEPSLSTEVEDELVAMEWELPADDGRGPAWLLGPNAKAQRGA